MKIKQELRDFGVILRGVHRLSPAGRRWLLQRLLREELRDEFAAEYPSLWRRAA